MIAGMAPTLAQTLELGAGDVIAVVGAVDSDDFEHLLDGLPRDDAAPHLLAFVRTPEDVARRAAQLARAAALSGGLAWAAYPCAEADGSAGLADDRGWDALTEHGLRLVRRVSLDETWSAVRVAPATGGA